MKARNLDLMLWTTGGLGTLASGGNCSTRIFIAAFVWVLASVLLSPGNTAIAYCKQNRIAFGRFSLARTLSLERKSSHVGPQIFKKLGVFVVFGEQIIKREVFTELKIE